jgi:hypothetical protein
MIGTMSQEKLWKTIERPGWFGEDRDRKLKEYDEKYGQGNWRIRHRLGPYILDFDKSVKIYELCYEMDFLHPDRKYVWRELINKAKEVWTEQLSDIDSGKDYSIQKAPAAHYEDIAIRRIFDKYRERFKGDKLIRIRADSEDLVGIALSSIHIPFIFPGYIEGPIDNISFPWYDRHKGSLECFWHLNKILQVKIKNNELSELDQESHGGSISKVRNIIAHLS